MNSADDQRLIEAVQARDETAVGQALADGADPNVTVGRFRGQCWPRLRATASWGSYGC